MSLILLSASQERFVLSIDCWQSRFIDPLSPTIADSNQQLAFPTKKNQSRLPNANQNQKLRQKSAREGERERGKDV